MEPTEPDHPDAPGPSPANDPAREGDELVGQTLAGRYAVTRVLGHGGMGVVVEARHLAMDRLVAVKLLHASFSLNRHAVSRFEREMKVASRLEHPGCVRVYDVGQAGPEADNRLFLAMELLRGQTLGALIEAASGQGTRLPHERIAALGAQIARALEAAHREGIVHRDLKPDNVMVLDTPEGEVVKVVDFGIARFFGDAEPGPLTAEGAVVGTPTYMSPEQAMGTEIGPASDLYALGVVLFEMATGEVPFSAPTHVSLMVKHVQEAPPRPSALAPVPVELERLILACLEKDPRARPASAMEVARRLDPLARPAEAGSARPSAVLAADTQRSRPGAAWAGPSSSEPAFTPSPAMTPAPPTRPEGRARRPLWPLGLGLGAIAVAIALVVLLGDPRPKRGAGPPEAVPDVAAAADAVVADVAALGDTAPSDTGPRAGDAAAASAIDAPPSSMGPTAPLPPASDPAASDPAAIRARLQARLSPGPSTGAPTLEACRAVAADAQELAARLQTADDAALAIADAVIARCPDWAQGYHLKGKIAQRQGRGVAARGAYLDALLRAPKWRAPRLNLAILDLDAGRPDAAEGALTAILLDEPGWVDALVLRAEARLRQNNPSGALADAKDALAAAPDRADAWMVRAAAEERLGTDDRGVASYCRAKALGHPVAAARCP